MAANDAASVVDVEAVKSEWLERLDVLVADVQAWAAASGWRTRRIQKTVEERELGRYKVPVLLMEKNAVEVVLNPVARFVPDADGAVDLYLSPAYDDIASVYHEAGRWFVRYSDPLDPKSIGGINDTPAQPCNEATIRAILDGMAVNA